MTDEQKRNLAVEIIKDATADIEHLTVAERLDDWLGENDEDPTGEELDRLADEVHELIDQATVTVTLPEGSGS